MGTLALRAGVIAVVLAVVTSPAFGQAAAPEDAYVGPALDGFIGKPISVDLHGVELLQVLRAFHVSCGVNMVLDPRDLNGVVTYRARSKPWNHALAEILHGQRLAVFAEGPTLRITTYVIASDFCASDYVGQPVSVDVVGGSVKDAVDEIGRSTGLRIIVRRLDHDRRITIVTSNLPWNQALAAILRSADLEAVRYGRTIMVGEPRRGCVQWVYPVSSFDEDLPRDP